MNLDIVNELFNNLKESKFVKNFMEELSNYLENNINNDSKNLNIDYEFQDLMAEDLTLYNKKVITKFRDEMLIERNNILQNYANKTKEKGEMYYIYGESENKNNAYNLYNCTNGGKEIITKSIEELPTGSNLGTVLRKKDNNFVLDNEDTKEIVKEIDTMIKEKIEEQNEFLQSKRIEGHVYEIGEKNSGRMWLYDQNSDNKKAIEGIEEIEIPKELYEETKEGDLIIYHNGKYHKKI